MLGRSPQHIARAIFNDDYHSFFTTDEMEWYTQLLQLSAFLTTIPFANIYKATRQARQQRLSWDEMRATIPEIILQAEEAEEEYQRRKALIETIVRSGGNKQVTYS